MGNMCKTYDEKENEIISHQNYSFNSLKNIEDSPREELNEIKEFKENILKISVFKRKKIAINKYNLFIKEYYKNNILDDINKIKSNYLQIRYLTLLDNTNKDIIRLYLEFLKNNSTFIKENKLNTYKKEINRYKVLFTIEEMNNIEKNIKLKSEKENYLDYLIYLSNLKENKYLDAFDDAKTKLKNFFLFNLPIEFENQELFYYKSFFSLLTEIVNNKKTDEKKNLEYINNKKNVLKYVLINSAFSNKDITNDENKANLLILYILKDKEGNLINFNRLFQKSSINKEDFFKFNKKKSEYINILKDYSQIISHQIAINGSTFIDIPLEKVCLNNLNNRKLDDCDSIISYYNLETLFKENEISRFVQNIKKFLIKIIDSNVYKEAIKILFPNYYPYLTLNNNEDIKTYIDTRMKFYPYENLNLSGITDKLGCYSFMTAIGFEGIKEIKKGYYKVGLTIPNCLHEINHTNQILIFFKGSDKNLINTPERQGFEIEEGENLEILLFGEIMQDIDLFQSLYILNEKNYEQDLESFRKNFRNIKNIVIETNGRSELINIKNGIFKEFYYFDDLNNNIKELENDSDYIMPTLFIAKINKKIRNKRNKKKCGLIGSLKNIK